MMDSPLYRNHFFYICSMCMYVCMCGMVRVVSGFNQNVAFISSPVYVDATIYYPRQFCVPFNLVTLLFYLYVCVCLLNGSRICVPVFWDLMPLYFCVVFSSSFECANVLCVSHSLQMKLNLFAIVFDGYCGHSRLLQINFSLPHSLHCLVLIEKEHIWESEWKQNEEHKSIKFNSLH